MFVAFIHIFLSIQQYNATFFVSCVYDQFLFISEFFDEVHTNLWKVRPTYGRLDLGES